ncbi:MAG: dihydrofolate reductase [Candidatus Omnitrophica bacterium]|nr:dihydrofolate reductase [Candidatus Omnitrophota bacterium]
MIPIDIIVAVDEKFGIGKGGGLPWRLSEDLRHFKKITTTAAHDKRNVVVMGRKTWESLPEKYRPLPERINVVLTRSRDLILPGGVEKAGSFQDVFNLLKSRTDWEKIFIIGGAEIYKEAVALRNLQTIYMTHVRKDFGCDKFFPLTKEEFENRFEELFATPVVVENEVEFYFAEYQKRKRIM